MGDFCRMKVHRRSFERSICLSFIKFINKNLQSLTAHFELLDPSLQACYRIIGRIHTSLTVYPSADRHTLLVLVLTTQKNVRAVLRHNGVNSYATDDALL